MHIRCCIPGTGYGLYSILSDGFACRGATVETEWARRRTLTTCREEGFYAYRQ